MKKNNKFYFVNDINSISNNKNKIYISFESRILIKLTLIIILFISSSFFIYKAFNNEKFFTYTAKSKTNYSICTNNNCFKNNIINNLNNSIIKFTNSYHANLDRKVSYNLTYKSVIKLKIYNSNKDILYEDTDILIPSKNYHGNSNNININNVGDINLNKYYERVLNYKNNYNFNINASIDLLFYLDNKVFSSITIPLKEYSNITINDLSITNEKIRIDNDTWNNYNSYYALIGLVLILICLVLIIKLTKFVSKSFGNKSNYQKELDNILKKYDKDIVNIKESYNYKKRNIVEVESFKELLDVHSNLQKPIIYSKINSVKSEFIIDNGKIIYKFIMKEANF